MKKLLIFVFSLTALNAVAESQSPIEHFVSTFPDKMVCDGVRRSTLGKETSVSVTVTTSGKDSDQPVFEVQTSANDHFKIGAGYAASLDRVKSPHAYHFDVSNRTMFYVPYVMDPSEIDENSIMRIRDAGGLMYVSLKAICFRLHQCVTLTNCKVQK